MLKSSCSCHCLSHLFQEKIQKPSLPQEEDTGVSHSRRNLQARNQEVKAFTLNSICRDLRYHFSQERSIHDSFCSFGSGQVTFFHVTWNHCLLQPIMFQKPVVAFQEENRGDLVECNSSLTAAQRSRSHHVDKSLITSVDLTAAYGSSKGRQPEEGVQPAPWRVIEKVCACTSLCEELFGISDPMRALETVRPVQWKITLFSF